MAPPVFSDLGKPANNVFEKGYPLGIIKFEANSDSCRNPEFKLAAGTKFEDKSFLGVAECKQKIPDYGLTITKKWTTNNDLSFEATCDDQIKPGVKVALAGSFNPDSGVRGGQGKVSYKVNNATVEANLTLGNNTNPIVNATAVGGYKGFLGGVQLGYDTQEGTLTKNNLAALFCAQNFQVAGRVENLGEKFIGSIYQRVSDRAEVAAMISYVPNGSGTPRRLAGGADEDPAARRSSTGGRRTSLDSTAPPAAEGEQPRRASLESRAPEPTPAPQQLPSRQPPRQQQLAVASSEQQITYAIGGRYLLDQNNSIRGKIDGNSLLSMSYETKIREGATVTAASMVDLKNVSGGGHKVGLGIEFTI